MQVLIVSQLQDQKANPESSGLRLQIITTLDFICSGDTLPGFTQKHGSKCVLGALGRLEVCSWTECCLLFVFVTRQRLLSLYYPCGSRVCSY